MSAGIISTGDEIISGQTADGNFQFLARQLGQMGIAVQIHVAVGDDREQLTRAVGELCPRCAVVLLTGGLGPTADDITRYALADALQCPLRLDGQALEQIERCFARLKRPMSEVNKVQALIPASARAIENTCGTAPGITARLGQAVLFALPGVPHEMRAMFTNSVVPQLRSLGLGGAVIVSRKLHCCGTGESNIFSMISDLMVRPANPLVGITVSDGVISVIVTAKAESAQAAETMLDEMSGQLAGRLGDYVFGRDEQTLAMVVGGLLRSKKQKLALAESCTGGLVGKLLTDEPGASDFLIADVVSYANSAKVGLLAVPQETLHRHGAVSEEAARAMACGAVECSGADWGLSITGIAGPSGGTAEKPVGLVFCGLARRAANGKAQVVEVREWRFVGERGHIRSRAGMAALDLLRRALLAGN